MMAKRGDSQAQFKGMEETTPVELLDLGREYKNLQVKESKAKAATKAKVSEILEKMHELKIERFRVEVNGNLKWLTIDVGEKLKWEKSESEGPSE